MTSLLQQYASAQAQARPDATAVVINAERVSYGELEASSNRLARFLKQVGCRRGDRVGLFLPKTPAAIAAMLGVLKADCIYVPIDVTSPAARIERVLRVAEPRLLLAAGTAAALLDDLVARAADGRLPPVASVETGPIPGRRFESPYSSADWAHESAEPLPWANSAGDPAHLLFTSGSTGTPKGVVITHSNVSHFVEWARGYFGLGASDRISGHPPLYFDLSTFDVYGTLSAGAQLHMVPPAANLLPHELAAFIRRSELTQWFSVPSVLTYLAKFDAVAFDDYPALKRVLWCGDVLPTATLIHWMERLPHATFTNLYGPTETTIASSYYTVPRRPTGPGDVVPIGVPCAGEELLVLDADLRPVRPGDAGHLYIAGVGLSPGYWGDEERTAAAFLPDPRAPESQGRIYRTGDLARVGDDGLVYYLGRVDSQVKSRGYRIELGEVETAVNALPGLRECAVVGLSTGGFEGTAICCAYALRADAERAPAQLRQELARSLPTYMLPSRWMSIDELPKNANGKVDRNRLRELFGEGPA